MVGRLIRLRFLQLYRGSADAGLFRILFLAVVILPFAGLFLIQRIAVQPYPFAIPAAVLYIIWLVHGRRMDYHFLVAIQSRPAVVYFSEYLLFTLPVTVLLVSAALYVHGIVFAAGMFFIAFMVPSREVEASRAMKLQMIPAGMFEWQSGIRKNLVAVILFYIPGLFGFYHIGLSAFSLFLLTMLFVSFYSEYEPLNMLMAGAVGSWKFLLVKVARHAGLFAMVVFPLMLIAFIHKDFRWLTTAFFLASLNLVTFSILLKYYQYRPGAYSGAHQMLTTLACFISVILPVALFFVMFNLFLAWGANRNLRKYLDAGN